MMLGIVALVAYILVIPGANWLIENVGTTCYPGGPCVVPVWWGIECPSGSLLIGWGLVLRDVVQRGLGKWWALVAIALGTAASSLVAPPALVVASAVAFAFSELVVFAIYTPLYQRRFVLAVAVSALAGLVVDSILFLWLAFGSLDLLAGLVIGKAEMVLIALPAMFWVRRYYARQPVERMRKRARELMDDMRRG